MQRDWGIIKYSSLKYNWIIAQQVLSSSLFLFVIFSICHLHMDSLFFVQFNSLWCDKYVFSNLYTEWHWHSAVETNGCSLHHWSCTIWDKFKEHLSSLKNLNASLRSYFSLIHLLLHLAKPKNTLSFWDAWIVFPHQFEENQRGRLLFL